jgi:hypothetical protein
MTLTLQKNKKNRKMEQEIQKSKASPAKKSIHSDQKHP